MNNIYYAVFVLIVVSLASCGTPAGLRCDDPGYAKYKKPIEILEIKSAPAVYEVTYNDYRCGSDSELQSLLRVQANRLCGYNRYKLSHTHYREYIPGSMRSGGVSTRVTNMSTGESVVNMGYVGGSVYNIITASIVSCLE